MWELSPCEWDSSIIKGAWERKLASHTVCMHSWNQEMGLHQVVPNLPRLGFPIFRLLEINLGSS